MFSKDENVAKAQQIMLEILLEIHRICEDNNLIYWLDAGTLLGAIRHKGFIPWDDDCDISMPRKDYNKFLAIAQEYLPNNMFLQHKGTDKKYPENFAKVRMLGTELIEHDEDGTEDYCHGIFVDIFPYDRYDYEWFMNWMKWLNGIRSKKGKYKKGSIKRTFVSLYVNVILFIPLQISYIAKKFFIKNKSIICSKEGMFFTYGLECCPIRMTKIDDILPVCKGQKIFEGYDFCIPNNSDAVLKNNFGNDYMILPPIEKRGTHAKRIVINI